MELGTIEDLNLKQAQERQERRRQRSQSRKRKLSKHHQNPADQRFTRDGSLKVTFQANSSEEENQNAQSQKDMRP